MVAVIGARRVPSRWYLGFCLLLAVVGHVLDDGWHFWEHYTLRDPVAPHLPASRSGPGTAGTSRILGKFPRGTRGHSAGTSADSRVINALNCVS